MDTIIIDVSHAPAGAAHRGALVALLDHDITVDELASRAGTIGYEVLTQLGQRTQRRIIGV